MDFSIFARVVALRDETRALALSGQPPELSGRSRGARSSQAVKSSSRSHEKLAAGLIARAAALHRQASEMGGEDTRSARNAIAALLRAASAPLPAFDESKLARLGGQVLDGSPDRPVVNAPRPPVDRPRQGLTNKRAAQEEKRKQPRPQQRAPKRKAPGKKQATRAR